METWKGLEVIDTDDYGTYLRVPFRVRELEIYEPEGLFESPDIEEVPVSLDTLVAVQDEVMRHGVQRYLDDPHAESEFLSLPLVIRSGGFDYIVDGTHRFTAAYLRGDRTLLAKVEHLDSLERNPKLKRRLMR